MIQATLLLSSVHAPAIWILKSICSMPIWAVLLISKKYFLPRQLYQEPFHVTLYPRPFNYHKPYTFI